MSEIELLKTIFKDSPDILEPLNEIGKEIEDLKNQIELLVKDDESNQQTIIKQSEEIERLQNIIKEVRELKEDKKIEKVNTYVLCDYDFKNKDDDNNLIATNILDKALEEYSHKINEIIDKLNEMENE